MTIYFNQALRLKIKKMIEDKQISCNLCYLCIAHLNEKINYANRDYSVLIPKRNALAKILIENGIDKNTIIQNVKIIHQKNESPTLKQVNAVCDIALSDDYTFIDEMIPNEFIIYKTEKEIEIDSYRQTREAIIKEENKKIQEIVEYISQTFTYFTVEKINIEKIKKIKTKIYSYDFILYSIKANTSKLKEIIRNEKIEDKGKFNYFIASVDNMLKENYKNFKQKEELENTNWRYNAYSVYLGEENLIECISKICSYESYVGKEEYVTYKLKKALVELHGNEFYQNICRVEREKNKIFNRPKAIYKSKNKKTLNPKFDDLW